MAMLRRLYDESIGLYFGFKPGHRQGDGFEACSGRIRHCVLHGRTHSAALEAAEAEVAKFGVPVHSLVFDVTDREAARRALLDDVEAFGAYWGIVVNAGITRDGTFAGMEPENWDDVVNTDLNGFYNIVQPLVMPIVHARRGGRIVAVSSISGIAGNRGQVNYSAAKAGLIGAVKALAVELASRGITVNAVAPGLIKTEMADSAVLERAVPYIPMKRAGRPEEVAAAIAFLMNDDAGYITRSVIEINGGLRA